MRILFQSRKTLHTAPGGDTVQILKTKEYLEKLGVEVDLSLELTPDVSRYDIVHVFNLMRPQDIYLQVMNAKKYGKKVALSTIYGPYEECYKKGKKGLVGFLNRFLSVTQIEYLKVIARALLNFEFSKGTLAYLLKGHKRLQRIILANTDVFLPNSDSEMLRVARDFDLKKYNYRFIPNSVDIHLFDESIQINPKYEKFRDCVLCVARIEGRKNQLNVIKALHDTPYPLVFIGKAGRNAKGYYQSCIAENRPNTFFLGQRKQEELVQFYKLSKVHILASWMETPGLSSLEAGCMGANLVVTKKGDVEDYFKEYAFYCEPDDLSSIREAITQAMKAPRNPAVSVFIRDHYTWEKTAEETLKAYQSIL